MAKNRLLLALGGLLLMGMMSSAIAADDYNKTLAATGVQSGTGYFRVVEPLSVTCLFGVIYVPSLSTDAGQRAMYATVLAAQSSGQKITHVGYDVNSSGQCMANLVETAP